MTFTRTAASLHKWLALVAAVPILFWFASGLFFAAVPIERVRSEHRIADVAAAPLTVADTGAALARLSGLAADRIEVKRLIGRPVAVLHKGESVQLIDLASGRSVSPLPAMVAIRIAEADLSGPARALGAKQVTGNSPEYRGPLPAWRVDFQGAAARSIYIAAEKGAVTARRSTLWRAYDTLWALHILDFEAHEDFNTPLLVIAAALALAVAATGLLLFPGRLLPRRWRRRRPSQPSSAR